MWVGRARRRWSEEVKREGKNGKVSGRRIFPEGHAHGPGRRARRSDEPLGPHRTRAHLQLRDNGCEKLGRMTGPLEGEVRGGIDAGALFGQRVEDVCPRAAALHAPRRFGVRRSRGQSAKKVSSRRNSGSWACGGDAPHTQVQKSGAVTCRRGSSHASSARSRPSPRRSPGQRGAQEAQRGAALSPFLSTKHTTRGRCARCCSCWSPSWPRRRCVPASTPLSLAYLARDGLGAREASHSRRRPATATTG